jgi:hypothetical protein
MLKDHVLILPEPVVKISDIIELPDTDMVNCFGKVIAIGPEVTEVAVGDTVHYEKIDYNRAPDEMIVVAEGEILAKEVSRETKG